MGASCSSRLPTVAVASETADAAVLAKELRELEDELTALRRQLALKDERIFSLISGADTAVLERAETPSRRHRGWGRVALSRFGVAKNHTQSPIASAAAAALLAQREEEAARHAWEHTAEASPAMQQDAGVHFRQHTADGIATFQSNLEARTPPRTCTTRLGNPPPRPSTRRWCGEAWAYSSTCRDGAARRGQCDAAHDERVYQPARGQRPGSVRRPGRAFGRCSRPPSRAHRS